MILPCNQLLCAAALWCLLLVWHDIVCLREERYCSVLFWKVRGFWWVILNSFLILVCHLYSYCAVHATTIDQSIQLWHERDLLALRRICIAVSLLFTTDKSAVVLLVFMLITGKLHPLSYRISNLQSGWSIAELSEGSYSIEFRIASNSVVFCSAAGFFLPSNKKRKIWLCLFDRLDKRRIHIHFGWETGGGIFLCPWLNKL